MTIEETNATRPSPAGYPGMPLPQRDVRSKRPPALSFLLRMETFRRLARVASLLVVDYVGVVAALFAALLVKLLLTGNNDVHLVWEQTKQWSSFAYLIVVLMFARVDLYADRARRP